MSMDGVKVQAFESFTGRFFPIEPPKEVVLLITRSPVEGRVRLFGVNVRQGRLGFTIEADAEAKSAIEQRLAGELAESGGVISTVWDGSRVAQGVVGPGPAPGPGPIGMPSPPEALALALSLSAIGQLFIAGQLRGAGV
jgi:hypothetical protein